MFLLNDVRLLAKFGRDFLERADRYLVGLSPAAKGLITEYKLGLAMGEKDFQLCRRFLDVCVELGIMQNRYAVMCPVCGNILYLQDPQDIHEKDGEAFCQYCDEIYAREMLAQQDVKTIFKLVKEG